MKTVSVMEVRKHLGALLDEVNLKSETMILERAGKPIAMLTPLERPASHDDQTNRKLRALHELSSLNVDSERGLDVDGWLDRERGDWEADS